MLRSRQSGFTLVELMVAVTITALLLSTIYGVFAAVSGSREQLAEAGAAYHEARVLFDRIGREVRGAYYNGQNPQTRFAGGVDDEGRPFLSLTTTTSTPQGGHAGGIAWVRYQLRIREALPGEEPERNQTAAKPEPGEDEEIRILTRSEQPLLGVVDEVPLVRLSQSVRDMQLRFFANGSWHGDWQATPGRGLPRLVELTLWFEIDGEQRPFRSAFDIPG